MCSIYLPHHQITGVELEDLILQLPQPFLLLGDVNARSTLWGCPTTDLRGRLLEDLIFNHPISVLNDGTATHYHVQTDTHSTIDLSACSSDIFDDLEYKVLASRYSSDHYPIRVSWKTAPIVLSAQPRYKTDSANWAQFRCLTEIAGDVDVGTTDDLLQSIKDVLISAADASIPMSSGRITRPPVIWWNDQCREAKKSRNIAERALRRHYSLVKKIRYSRAKAFCKYTMHQQRLLSFQSYVQSINQKTSLHQIWKKVRKIEGKFTPSPSPVLQDLQGNLHSDPEDVANMLADHFASVSGPENYTPAFQRYRLQEERKRLNFETPYIFLIMTISP